MLRRDGTLWLNYGDCYASSVNGAKHDTPSALDDRTFRDKPFDTAKAAGLKPKDLVGMPWRVALALQADGWYLRSDIIWAKPNPMPESVTDRPTKSHEYVFLMAKSERYYYDAEALRESAEYGRRIVDGWRSVHEAGRRMSVGTTHGADPDAGRNSRTVWTIATQPYPEAHFATFPEELARRCIVAGTSERGCCPTCAAPWVRQTSQRYERTQRTDNADKQSQVTGWDRDRWPRSAKHTATTGWAATCGHEGAPVPCVVLDPFAGSGTTLAVAKRLDRQYLGVELNAAYAELAETRIAREGSQITMPFAEAAS